MYFIIIVTLLTIMSILLIAFYKIFKKQKLKQSSSKGRNLDEEYGSNFEEKQFYSHNYGIPSDLRQRPIHQTTLLNDISKLPRPLVNSKASVYNNQNFSHNISAFPQTTDINISNGASQSKITPITEDTSKLLLLSDYTNGNLHQNASSKSTIKSSGSTSAKRLFPMNGMTPESSKGLRGSTPLINVTLLAVTTASSPPPEQQSLSLSKDAISTASTELSSTRSNFPSTMLPSSSQTSVAEDITTIDLADIKLDKVIGGGGFGQVWRGSWRGTPVAVKILSAVYQQEQIPPSILQSFRDEVALLSHARHPNICLFMGASFIPPQRAIITEFVDRGSLWDALRQDNSTLFTGRQETIFSPVGLHWPEWAIRRVLEGACMGLSYLHGHTPPILHRDLKSANLLLTESFQVKICDFGLARLRSLSSAMTAQVGTAQWMAPEVIAGGSYCESADIYSLGLVVWELLTGECPFEGLNASQIVAAVVIRGDRPPMPPQASISQMTLLTSCWNSDQQLRPSATEVLNRIPICFPDIL